jgi:defect-in-organelle-trafficking protein DotB
MVDSLTSVPDAPAAYRWPEDGKRFVHEPRKSAPGLDSLLTWAFRAGASRIGFQPGHSVWVRIHGRNYRATEVPLDAGEFSSIVNHFYGAEGTARLQRGDDFDTAYAISLDRSTRLRFRLSATLTPTSRWGGGNVVLRPIPDLPPSLADQCVEQGILDNYRAAEGMVIVAGGAGSGRSTLIAGMTVAKLMDPNGNYDIAEGAAPIEFQMERLHGATSRMNQIEIPRDVKSSPAFIRRCMRWERTEIIVGECRDSETMDAALCAAMSGYLLTTSISASNVPLTLQRMASLCPADERANAIFAVAQSLRLVINQRLVPTIDGKRMALREFLVVDKTLRAKFTATDPRDWPALTREAVEVDGQSYAVAIERALSEGRISEEVAQTQLARTA